MSSTLDAPDGAYQEERKQGQTPPAFLDLADSAARLGSSMHEHSTRVDSRRMEHDRQRAIQRQAFGYQIIGHEKKQAPEFLAIPMDASLQPVAVSAPTTPPRLEPGLPTERHQTKGASYIERGLPAPEQKKSVSYAILDQPSQEHHGFPGQNRAAGAKSMPGSRRPSTGSHDSADIDHLIEGLSIHQHAVGLATPIAPGFRPGEKRHLLGSAQLPSKPLARTNMSAGDLLDEQLDKEMQSAMLHLPISDDDRVEQLRSEPYGKLSTASAALDLAPLAQTPPRTFAQNRGLDITNKPSEWPQFSNVNTRFGRRTATNPAVTNTRPVGLSQYTSTVSSSVTSFIPRQASDSSRRSSPLEMQDNFPTSNLMPSTRSVPVTPLSGLPVLRQDPKRNGKSPGSRGANSQRPGRAQHAGIAARNDQSPSVETGPSPSNASAGFDSPLTFTSIQGSASKPRQIGATDGLYGLTTGVDSQFAAYPPERAGRTNSGSTALYQHNGARYGLGLAGRMGGSDNKMNGLHGQKHKRPDAEREFNRFTGTRLEDLRGEIASLCKDQHGCRYLQKKLEEGTAEHRDLIFRETFGHFSELMTDPFGNYLCQKLLEYSTDDQRTVICESVARDLVNISLNMHGTRAVQKMIDFLSSQRQGDARFDSQIRSIIVALSRHVVVLIKDLNGNHVIQKCLNKLTPEDNQFIYNAVAANCVEVATHRHGCCVLQRCIDHASDSQRVQLVNEITYNALTLIQDPYGNYVVQYILDLNDNRFSDAVIRQFTGNVCALSVQKFSSNVIEKCIRVAEHSTRKVMVDEMLHRSRLEKLLRDSYGNYCVQTALDYADPAQRNMLVEGIRPILPVIRNTPYGKRIQSKLQREQLDLSSGAFTSFPRGFPMGGAVAPYAAPPPHNVPAGPATHQQSQMADYYSVAPIYQASGGHSQTLEQGMQSAMHLPSNMLDPYGIHAGNGPPDGQSNTYLNSGRYNGSGVGSGVLHGAFNSMHPQNDLYNGLGYSYS